MKNYLTPIQAIRKNCLDCSGGSSKEVRECILTQCPLYPYRNGTNPNRAGINRRVKVVAKKPDLSELISRIKAKSNDM